MLNRRSILSHPIRLPLSCAVAFLLAGPLSLQAAGTRIEDQRLTYFASIPAHSHFGASLAMTRDSGGAFAMIGTHEGHIGVFEYHAPAWEPSFSLGTGAPAVQLFPMDLELGTGIAAIRHASGNTTIRTFVDGGADVDLLAGVEGTYVKAVALYGDVLVLGQPDQAGGAGRIQIYEWNSIFGWGLAATFNGATGDRLGSALAMKEGLIAAGAPGYGANGAVRFYGRGEEWFDWTWIESPATSQTGAEFGAAVDLSLDGMWVAVGSYAADDLVVLPGGQPEINVGAVYLYRSVFLGWELEGLVRPLESSTNDNFGYSVALHDDILVAGSPGEDGASIDEGAAYVYQYSGSQWRKRMRLADSAPEPDEQLGWSVAVGDLGALVGAPYFDGNGVLDQGAVLAYGGIVTLFEDGFESGDFSAWSAVVP